MPKRSTEQAVYKQEIERWKKRGEALKAAEERVRKTESFHQWRLAEWMLEGVDTFRAFYRNRKKSDRDKIAYKAASRVTGMTVDTLRQFVHTRRNVLTRVNGLSFGHHRLVASFRGKDRKKRQADALNHARTHKLNVEKFAEYVRKLKGLNRADEREENVPTNPDSAALLVIERCKSLAHDLEELLQSKAPPEKHREELVTKLKTTADDLNRAAHDLRSQWSEHDSLQALQNSKSNAARAGAL
jgi:hypothetical protein